MKKKNSAQMMGQIFIFILALIIFAGVLLYGFRAVGSITKNIEGAEFISFYDDLRAKVKQTSVDYGSVKKFKATPPQGFIEMCFLDLRKLQSEENFNDLREEHPLIADAVEGGSDQNLYFTPLADTPTQLPPLELEGNGVLCFPIGKADIELRLEGLGDRTKLTEWK